MTKTADTDFIARCDRLASAIAQRAGPELHAAPGYIATETRLLSEAAKSIDELDWAAMTAAATCRAPEVLLALPTLDLSLHRLTRDQIEEIVEWAPVAHLHAMHRRGFVFTAGLSTLSGARGEKPGLEDFLLRLAGTRPLHDRTGYGPLFDIDDLDLKARLFRLQAAHQFRMASTVMRTCARYEQWDEVFALWLAGVEPADQLGHSTSSDALMRFASRILSAHGRISMRHVLGGRLEIFLANRSELTRAGLAALPAA